ncbi:MULTISPECIES: adenosylmethionine--8-amino-7-oxononanoate transaminase [Brucella/Ochrobactrum group]|uniref:adenosylmethionine--8-amino-7-oxononanoate transaminase n=1 Tax=Brucella/Ochrobactrum group TaxID=2826938 RepID=UPI001C04812C|nr:adenosylmethionine--8-amino-7-oxononanoate transaminase [Brucella sp. NBRC 12950]QWK81825.1 adenosylmethionine--8-amino-7-oxononanoate transaminase [Ochrobactrum sp. BTU1]GLU28192.1 adenosylmethionine--8-amino-7-oxononanoate aminotransferase BioA [Brucella sp. NBRC 12950]
MTHSPTWYPFTQHALDLPFKTIKTTEGAYLFDEDGNRIFDAISSWWVTTHGHRHPRIMAAIRHACENIDQIIFSEFTHAPAENLAKKLLAFAPSGLGKVFYSDSGSTAVEVAIKMALGAFYNRGIARNRIVVMEHSYHGDTIGTMSVGERGVFNAPFTPLLFNVDRIPFPQIGSAEKCIDAFEACCRRGNVAALLVEPLVLGAGGMKFYSASVLSELKNVANRYGCLFIADEVMTGWGRTGTPFACCQAGITPDILCTSKGLTGGSLPLAATLCTEEIFSAHFSSDRRKTFFHSSSYTANPIACAAALANLDIWSDEPVAARIDKIIELNATNLARFKNDPRFNNVRQCGTIAALDLGSASNGYLAETGQFLRRFCRGRGVLLRPLGNVVYLMPPYCSSADDLSATYDAIDEAASLCATVTT